MHIAIFRNARAVIAAETKCRELNIEVSVRAVPESVSSECGLCLEILKKDINTIKQAIPALRIYEI